MALSREDQTALNDLQFHWEDAYLIGHDHQRRLWWARFTGTTDELSAGAAEELKNKIRYDYAERNIRFNDHGPVLADRRGGCGGHRQESLGKTQGSAAAPAFGPALCLPEAAQPPDVWTGICTPAGWQSREK